MKKNIFPESNKQGLTNVIPSVQPTEQLASLKNNNTTNDSPEKLNTIVKGNRENDVAVKETTLVKNVAQNEENEDDNDNRILYVKEEKLKNTKVGKFFGKMKNVLNSKNNINTGNSIHVGKLEIAFH